MHDTRLTEQMLFVPYMEIYPNYEVDVADDYTERKRLRPIHILRMATHFI